MEIKTILLENLANSNSDDRKKWATLIIESKLDLIELCSILKSDRKTAIRFAWMLTEIAEKDPHFLHQHLPYLFAIRKEITHFPFEESFANYWRFSGIPEENESEAIDLLFFWIQSSSTNKTIKSRAQKVLLKLCEKYPELKNEMDFDYF